MKNTKKREAQGCNKVATTEKNYWIES